LKRRYARSDVATVTTVREDYKKVLKQAEQGNVNPAKWYNDWNKALLSAQQYNV